MTWLGSSAADREGAVWTISDQDHPAQVLMTNGHKVSPGTMATIALTVSKVMITVHISFKISSISAAAIHPFILPL